MNIFCRIKFISFSKTNGQVIRLSQAYIKPINAIINTKSYHQSGIFDDDEDILTNSKRSKYSDKSYEADKYRPISNQNYYRNKGFKQNKFRNSFTRKPNLYGMSNRYNFENKTNDFGVNLTKPVFDLDNLPEIEKNFYIEHDDVSARSQEEIEKYRDSLNIHVSGVNIPKPIVNFNELNLPESLTQVINKKNYSHPTPIQSQGWPIVLSGYDMIGVSQTGSGKTLVFMLPGIIHAKNQQFVPSKNECKPQVLILAPTRELVQQIQQVGYDFIHACNLNSGSAYGGASKYTQLQSLRGANICIATPGRLIDFISEGLVNLEYCTYLVMDEADRMLDMGFEPQIRKIVEQIRPDRQTLMWSATWPKEIQNLAGDFLSNYIKVTVGSEDLVANPNIEQNIYVIQEEEKDQKLLSLLDQITSEKKQKILIFAQTKRKVDYLGFNLNKTGIPALCIHGDVSQSKRDRTLERFRREKSSILIATDVASRGLDITDVQHVVNYDFPPNIEDYIHRIGRTARGMGFGVSHSFFTSENVGLAKELISILKNANQAINPDIYSLIKQNKSYNFAHHRRNFQRNFSF